ncbi:MAG TPA: hypothetical protein VFG79_20180, partial [Solirubrobacter sp.]|nr:hypothetical protein [Solirubrobacter sp.]
LREARKALEDQGSEELSVRDLAARHCLTEDALYAFAEAAGGLMGEKPLSVAAARRAGLLAAAAEVWEHELGPLLSSAQVRELLGDVSRQRVDELLRSRRLIGLLDQGGRRRFPAFQFYDGRPQGPLVEAFWTVADAAVSPWTAASWCVSDDDQLDGVSPVRWVHEHRDSEQLALVARRDAARLTQ